MHAKATTAPHVARQLSRHLSTGPVAPLTQRQLTTEARRRLRRAFPATTFTIRSHHGIGYVSWAGGPAADTVEDGVRACFAAVVTNRTEVAA